MNATTPNALNDFKVFVAAKEILEEVIGITLVYGLELFKEDKYFFSGVDLYFEQMQDGEFLYSQEARLMKEFKDCEMYLVHSCTGDKYIAVFDKSNKVEG